MIGISQFRGSDRDRYHRLTAFPRGLHGQIRQGFEHVLTTSSGSMSCDTIPAATASS